MPERMTQRMLHMGEGLSRLVGRVVAVSRINRAILRMNYGEFYDRYKWSFGGPINGPIVGRAPTSSSTGNTSSHKWQV